MELPTKKTQSVRRYMSGTERPENACDFEARKRCDFFTHPANFSAIFFSDFFCDFLAIFLRSLQ